MANKNIEERFLTKKGTKSSISLTLESQYTTGRKGYNPYEELGYAIILQTVEDFKRGKINKIQAELFFNSDWFVELCLGTLDGPTVLKRILDRYEEKQNKI